MNGFESTGTSFNGIYPAEVIDVDDTPNTTGRVKVRVFPMMLGLSEAVLPWAVPAFGLFEGGGAAYGSFTVPAEGSRVWVFFSCGDVLSPVYFANAPGATDGHSARSPTRKVWATRTGHVIEIEDDSGSEMIKVTHKDGALIELDSSGNIKVMAKASAEVQLSAGGTIRKLLNELAGTLFNAHVHEYMNYGANGAAPARYSTGVPIDPALPPPEDLTLPAAGTPKGMGSTEETAETKAS